MLPRLAVANALADAGGGDFVATFDGGERLDAVLEFGRRLVGPFARRHQEAVLAKLVAE